MTKTEDDQNGRWPKWKTTKTEDDQREDDQNGRRPKGKGPKYDQHGNSNSNLIFPSTSGG